MRMKPLSLRTSPLILHSAFAFWLTADRGWLLSSQYLMRPIFLILSLFSLVATAPVVSYAQAPPPAVNKVNPSDIYFKGYLLLDDGAKLLQAKNYGAAYFKLKDASDLFEAVHQADPNWEPTIVEYRRKRVRELMDSAKKLEVERRQSIAATNGTVNPEPKAIPMDQPRAQSGRPLDVVVGEKSQELNQRINQLDSKNDALQREIGMRDEKLRQYGQQMLDAQRNQTAMLDKLTLAETKLQTADAKEKRATESLQKQVAQLTKEKEELRAKLADTADLLKKSTDEHLATLTEVQQAYAQIKQLTAEKEELKKEKLAMESMLPGGSPGGQQASAFTTDNARLRKQLGELQNQVKTLQQERDQAKAGETAAKAKSAEDQKLIAKLQVDLETARNEVATLKKQNTDYEEQMAALQTRLTETEQALGESGTTGGMSDQDSKRENQELRSVVLKMMKQQAGRMKAKEQALQLLEQSGKVSQDLLNTLTEMSAPYEMSAAERSVMNAAGSPLANMATSGGNGLEIEIVANISGNKPGEMPKDPSAKNPNQSAPTGAMDRQSLPPELKAFATAAETHFRNQEFVQSEDAYVKILEKEPRNVFALCNLAVVQIRRNKLEDVEVHLKKALAYQYDNEFAHLLLGGNYLRQARYTDAVASIQEALKINPKNSEAYASLGYIHVNLKNYPDSEKYLLKAVELDPTNGAAHMNLAIFYGNKYGEKSDRSFLELSKVHYMKAVGNGQAPHPELARLVDLEK